jgi:tetratricopeptide (TPR) repeat protein
MADEAIGSADGGSLVETPLPELLARLEADRFTGGIELSVGNRTHKMTLVEGRLVKAQLAVPVEPLGRVLVERGLIASEKLDEFLRRQPSAARRLGEMLVGEGVIDAAALDEALTEQVRRRLLRLFLAGDGTYRVCPECGPIEGGLPQPLNPLSVVPEGVRNSMAPDDLEVRLQKRLGGRTATVRRDADWSRLGFTAAEQSACRYLARGSWDAGVFRSVPAQHRPTLLVAAYCLLAVGQVVVAAPSFDPEPKADGKPAQDDPLKAEIAELHAALKERTHFELLGVTESAAQEEIRNRYLELVKRYHPDRAGRHGLTDMVPQLEEILITIREAVETLTDPERRKDYVARLKGEGAQAPAEVREMVDRAVAAERSYQLAVALERQHKPDEAQKAADEALRLAPGQGEYECMSLWLKSVRRPPRAAVSDLVQPMVEAAALVVKHERAQMQAARLLQRAGRADEAGEFFRRVLLLNPQNVDAAREIRLKEMRTSRQPPPSHGGGLLDRLLGRKGPAKGERRGRGRAASRHRDRGRQARQDVRNRS